MDLFSRGRFLFCSFSVAFATVLVSCGAKQLTPVPRPAVVAPETTPEAGRLPSDVIPTHYALSLTVDPREENFSGEVTIELDVRAPRRTFYLHGAGMTVTSAEVIYDSVSQAGEWTGHEGEDSFARLSVADTVQGNVTLRIRYEAPFDTQLSALYRVEHGGESYAFTQLEPLAARKMFPSFDEPRFKTPYDVTLRVPQDMTAIANAPELPADDSPSKPESIVQPEPPATMKEIRFATSAPIPSYLVAIAVGPFDVVTGSAPANAVRTEALPFRGIAPKGRGAELAYAMEHTPALLEKLELYFGRAYPFQKLDIVAVPDFEAGAMENVGLVTFRDSLLLVNEEESPTRLLQFFAYIMAHELAHMWFGNLVTMEWWDDLWLNEAFASWMEHRAVHDWRESYESYVERTEWVLNTMREDSLATARQIRQPIVSSHDIHNAFDGITYGKGAGVITMFERWLGEDAFRQGVQAYLAGSEGGNATAADLMRELGDAGDRDVATPFNTFLTQPGVPFLETSLVCGDDGNRIELKQSRYAPLASSAERDALWQIPVCVRYGVERGEAKETCTLLTDREGSIALDEACPTWVMPNAEQSGYYRFGLSEALLEGFAGPSLDRLSTAEQLALADSLEAGYAAGAVSTGAIMPLMLRLGESEHHAVASAPLGFFRHLLDDIADASQREKLVRRLRRSYASRARQIGWENQADDTEAAKLLRSRIQAFVAISLEERRAVRSAARLGNAYVTGGEVHTDAVAPDLATPALIAAVRAGDSAFYEELLMLLPRSQDSTVRRRLLEALGSTRDASNARKALALSHPDSTTQTGESEEGPTLRVNELLRVPRALLSQPAHVPLVRTWVEENIDNLTARLSAGNAGWLPQMFAGTCDPEVATWLETFFGPRVADLPGGPRNLQSAVESIGLCAAQVEAHREELGQYL